MFGMVRYILLGISLTLTSPIGAAEPKIAIGFTHSSTKESSAIEVRGVEASALAKLRDASLSPNEWKKLLRIVVAEGSTQQIATRPPVAGSYRVVDQVIRFEPLFSLTPGVKYQVTFEPAMLPLSKTKAPAITVQLLIPKPKHGPATAIVAVYPSANKLPENTLRFYIHFSHPMKRGNIYRHFKLFREDGIEVSRPFLELDEELWSLDGKRLTLLFDPGRVKRGLVPREEEGPVLESGQVYTLVISKDWEDASGQPLAAEHRKRFAAGPMDDQPVKPLNWALMPPRAFSTSPLILRLPKPFDHALLGSMIWVAHANGERVPGTVTVGGGERVVTFAPRDPWVRGEFKLIVDTRLEDSCGNRVGKPFEVDLRQTTKPRREKKTVERSFTVR